MEIIPIPSLTDNYIWLIVDTDTQQALCIDPGEAMPVLNFLKRENFSLQAILLTHHHDDHIGGTAELVQANPSIAVYGPYDVRIPHVTHHLQDNEVLTLGSCQLQIIATPGHTSSHICLYESKQHWLFCGDTLFSAGCGRVFDGSTESLFDSLQKIKSLPEETQIYCAHEYTLKNLQFAATVEPHNLLIRNYIQQLRQQNKFCTLPSTLAIEKQINPFLRTELPAIKEYARQKGCRNDDSLAVFKQIRAEKDKF